jgi:hypothetical protein
VTPVKTSINLSMAESYLPFINNKNLVLFNFVTNSSKKYKLTNSTKDTLEVIRYFDPSRKYNEKVYLFKEDGIYLFSTGQEKLSLKFQFDTYKKFECVYGITNENLLIGRDEEAFCFLHLDTNKYKVHEDFIQEDDDFPSIELSDGSKGLFLGLLDIEKNKEEVFEIKCLVYNKDYLKDVENRFFQTIKFKPANKDLKSNIYKEDCVFFTANNKLYLRVSQYSTVDVYEMLLDKLEYKLVYTNSTDNYDVEIENKNKNVINIDNLSYFINKDYVIVKYNPERDQYSEVYEFI